MAANASEVKKVRLFMVWFLSCSDRQFAVTAVVWREPRFALAGASQELPVFPAVAGAQPQPAWSTACLTGFNQRRSRKTPPRARRAMMSPCSPHSAKPAPDRPRTANSDPGTNATAQQIAQAAAPPLERSPSFDNRICKSPVFNQATNLAPEVT